MEFEIDFFEIVEVLDEVEKKGFEIVGVFYFYFKCLLIFLEKDFRGMNLW